MIQTEVVISNLGMTVAVLSASNRALELAKHAYIKPRQTEKENKCPFRISFTIFQGDGYK